MAGHHRRSRGCRSLAQCVAGAAAACALAATGAWAQGQAVFPQRNVQIVVPFTPGVGADILARLLGPRLSERWKVSVIVENRAGATGNIGADLVAKAAPDGHTMLFAATSFGTTPSLYRNLPFDPVKSFAPLILIATSGLGLVVHPQLPAKSVREFVQLAKRRPGDLLYSSPGNGGPQHLTMELLKLESGINIVHVPYKGLAGAITDVMGGHVQAMVSALQTAHPYVTGGRLRMLGVMSAERSPAFPGVATFREQGLPSLEVYTWYAAFAPAGTPAAAITRINTDINALLQQPEIRELLEKQGTTPGGGTPERLGELVRSELARWQRVVSAAKIKAD